MKKLKIALVGCGDVARFIALAGKLNKKIDIVACADINEKKATGFSKWFRIKHVFTDYQTMLNSMDLDAVYLAVPHYLHISMIKPALEMGLNVLCEKPVTTKMADAIEVCRMSDENGCKVGINYQYRYDRGCFALATAARRGDLGKLLYAKTNVPWNRKETYFSNATWHASLEQSGGGTLITQASHVVDISMWALGGKPINALGIGKTMKFHDVEVEDIYMGTVEMDNGSLLQVTSSMISIPERPLSIEVYGSKGTGLYKGPLVPRVSFKGAKVKKAAPPVKGIHAFFASLEGFRQWIQEDKPYLMPVAESLPVLAAVLALYRSSQTGKKEPVEQYYEKSV